MVKGWFSGGNVVLPGGRWVAVQTVRSSSTWPVSCLYERGGEKG